MSAILPGATIGIFGGGQLGRMMAMAARGMGYRIQVLDPDAACPARFVVDECIEAGWDDTRAATQLGRASDVVTLEIEQISVASLDAAASFAPVRPGSAMMGTIQDRIEQKNWLTRNGFPVGAYKSVRSLDDLREGVRALGGGCFVKSARGGYDGRSQVKLGFSGVATEDDVREAWSLLGESACVVERGVPLAKEISVMVARSPRGEIAVYPAALNHHENQILAWSVIPATISAEMDKEAREIAEAIADTFQLEGLLAVELFVTEDGKLLVNELAPRPHNSYHGSERACVTSQFEQAVRAICDLPLGAVDVVQPAAIANLLGDLWIGEDGAVREPRFDAALAVPGVKLHLYEKLKPRKARKMGHLSAVGKTAEEATQLVLRAKALL